MILGIDEVGRGPWAGPLVVGAVVLPDAFDENGAPIAKEAWQDALADSKKLTAKKREALASEILEKAVRVGLGWVSADELDEFGLAYALRLATRRAVYQIFAPERPSSDIFLYSSKSADNLAKVASAEGYFSEIIIDGTQNFLVGTSLEKLVSVLPKADAKIKAVSAASIVAKVARDNYMVKLVEKYPEYGFEKHVGYGTAAHKKALEKYGPCPEHRRSFKPIAKLTGVKNDENKFNCVQSNFSKKFSTSTKNGSCTATTTTQTGSRAEKVVADYLESQGHKIIARNFKTKFYEIDIVSADKEHIYFTEVKYRMNNSHGAPLDFIDTKKRRQISFAAESFMNLLSQKLGRSLADLPSPILAAAAVEGPDFTLAKWLPIVV